MSQGEPYRRTHLPNGIRVVSAPMPHVRSASLIVGVMIGSRHERPEEAGVAHFVEHMLFKGTARRPTPAIIAETIEGVGGALNAGTGREVTTYWAKVPGRHLALAYDLIGDMLLNSLFDPVEIDKERAVIVEEINSLLDSPADLVHELIDEVVWGGQAVGRSITGRRETVEALSRAQMLDFMARGYAPNGLVVAAAGAVDHNAVVDQTISLFGHLAPAPPLPSDLAESAQAEPRAGLLPRPTEQVNLCLAVPALSYRHPDHYVQNTLDIILGAGMSSRLFQSVRERQGLAYSVQSYVNQCHDVGWAVVSAGVDPRQTAPAIRAILAELARLRDEPVPADELRRAKEYRRGRLEIGLEDSHAVASWCATFELFHNEIPTPEEIIARVEGITAEAVQTLAGQLFRTERLNLAAIGPLDDSAALERLLEL